MKVKTFLRTDKDNRFILLSDSDINDVFKELEQEINDIEEIQKQVKKCEEEGLIPPENST